MKKTLKKKKTPSREKYEQSHPTVSARIPIETRVKLRNKLEILKTSLSELLKAIADDLEIKAKPVEEARREGYQQGYKVAQEICVVTYPCAKCGRLLIVSTPEEKADIKKFMKEHGWGHENCSQG